MKPRLTYLTITLLEDRSLSHRVAPLQVKAASQKSELHRLNSPNYDWSTMQWLSKTVRLIALTVKAIGTSVQAVVSNGDAIVKLIWFCDRANRCSNQVAPNSASVALTDSY